MNGENQEEKYKNICKKKMDLIIDEFCLGLPEQFSTYFNYCKNLMFKEKPNYSFLRKIFSDLFQ